MLWDYDKKKIEKTKSGRLLILERQINYGLYPSSKDKVRLSDVKKNWRKLKLTSPKRRLFKFLIWGK